jgi:putative glutamine amidotransferase
VSRPLIGITTYAQEVRFGAGPMYAAALPMAYVRAVNANGGRAVLLAPDDAGKDVIDHLDGLVLAGGSDVDPAGYGEAPHPTTVIRPDREEAEVALLRAALDADLPTLGVCRGLQLIVAAYGGRLHQHLPEVLGHERHRPAEPAPGATLGYGEHVVRLADGSRARAILGAEVRVNSFHHQGIADPGGMTATGWSDDGLIEVIEDPARRFLFGVQWHPEDLADQRVFAALTEAAARH